MIDYGPNDKLDKWGHVIKAAPVYKMYFDEYTEAKKMALQISREHKKWTVCLYDTQGPEEEDLPDTLWLIVAFEHGMRWVNDNYTKALRKMNLTIKY